MDQIARHAEVGRATLFKYFPTKAALLFPLGQQILGEELQPRLKQLLEADTTTFAILHELFELIGERVLAFPALARAFANGFSLAESSA